MSEITDFNIQKSDNEIKISHAAIHDGIVSTHTAKFPAYHYIKALQAEVEKWETKVLDLNQKYERACNEYVKKKSEVERLIYKERQYEEFKANVFAKAEKFVNKVECGRAKSKKTYTDMKELMETINLLNKEK